MLVADKHTFKLKSRLHTVMTAKQIAVSQK